MMSWLRPARLCLLALASSAVGAVLTAPDAQAVTISLVEAAPAPPLLVGETMTVEIWVSGLAADPDPTSLLAFELDVAYPEATLDFVSATFHPFLGTDLLNGSAQPCTLENLDAVCDVLLDQASSSGLVELGETSLWEASVVDDYQPASGLLATLVFQVQAEGSIALTLPQLALWGSLVGGGEGSLSATGVGLVLAAVPVPEPGTAALVLLGLVGLARRQRPS